MAGMPTRPVVTVEAAQLPVIADSVAAKPEVPISKPPGIRPDQR